MSFVIPSEAGDLSLGNPWRSFFSPYSAFSAVIDFEFDF